MARNGWKFSTFVLAGALSVMAIGQFMPEAGAEQPHMKAALELLEKAQNQLEKATADKGGHRQKAMDHVKAAMAEVKQGIAFDKSH